MPLTLYAHPFSSYCQKVLVALYENATPFSFRSIDLADPGDAAALAAVWPFRRFPVLVDDERSVAESSIIIEYLQVHHPGPVRLVPDDPDLAIEVRTLDRFFDNYVMTPQGKHVYDALRPAEHRDPYGVAEVRKVLDTTMSLVV